MFFSSERIRTFMKQKHKLVTGSDVVKNQIDTDMNELNLKQKNQ